MFKTLCIRIRCYMCRVETKGINMILERVGCGFHVELCCVVCVHKEIKLQQKHVIIFNHDLILRFFKHIKKCFKVYHIILFPQAPITWTRASTCMKELIMTKVRWVYMGMHDIKN
jgi:hypothetical protein